MFLCCDCQEVKTDANLKIKKVDKYIYRPNDKIGEGKYSSVYMGIDQESGTNVAIKVVRVNILKSQTLYTLLQQEIEIMKELKHPNIIQCFCAMNSPNNCYIITDYCQEGDLERYLKVHGSMDQESASKIAYDVFKGLQYLAKKLIVHRDLKVANIFLRDDGVAKIGDFGFAVRTGANIKDISVGSPAYMSPESLLRCQYGPKSDIWSFGVMLYQLVHGQTPHGQATSEEQLKLKITKPPKFKSTLSKELKNFIMLCLEPNEKIRISLKQMRETPFMKKVISMVQGGRLRKSQMNSEIGMDRKKLAVSNSFFKIKTEQAVAMVHYCRLLHKTTKQVPSMVLSQWLLTLSEALVTAKIQPKSDKTQKIAEVIKKYHKKYVDQHNYPKLAKTVDEAIQECQQVLRSPYPKTHAEQLLKQTEVLKKSLDLINLATFTKYSTAEQTLKTLQTARQNSSGISAGKASDK